MEIDENFYSFIVFVFENLITHKIDYLILLKSHIFIYLFVPFFFLNIYIVLFVYE